MSWRDDPEFNRTMDAIYASFMRRKPRLEGRHDREIRDPSLILDIAAELDLLPLPERTVRITGSKGKGTTSRMIARLVEQATGQRVGLMVSPEEIEHNDRMRVNGVAPTKAEFIALFDRLRPALERAEARLTGEQYLSPFGVFLLMSLLHFRDQQVDWVILEGGRGAAYDEVGHISSRVAVVTSIMLEHPASLGPTVEDVAANKLFAGTLSQRLVCPEDVAAWNDRLGMVPSGRVVVVAPAASQPSLPDWVVQDQALAHRTACELLGREIAPHDVTGQSAAFGQLGQGVYFDACINAASLDRGFLTQLTAGQQVVFVVSLPDDKDASGITGYISDQLHAPFHEIALTGTRGYLHYDRALAEGRVAAQIHYEDAAELTSVAAALKQRHAAQTLYFIGTQTFIRLVKHAYQPSAAVT